MQNNQRRRPMQAGDIKSQWLKEKEKPQQEHKPAEQQGAPKEGVEHKRRHRGGRRTHRGGGGKPQAPKAE